MRAYWMVFGVGMLVAVIGGGLLLFTDQQYGPFLLLGGMTVSIIGLMMRFAEWVMEKGKGSMGG